MQITDYSNNKLQIDKTTGAIAVQSDLHKMSHDGLAFEVTHTFSGIAAGASVNLVFEVPANVQLSAVIEGAADQSMTVQVLKLATLTPNGSNSLTPSNLLTGSSNTPDSTFSHTPTAMGAETQALGPRFFPAGGAGSGRSVIGELVEVHFSTGYYALRVTNNGSVAAKINPAIYFYEETP